MTVSRVFFILLQLSLSGAMLSPHLILWIAPWWLDNLLSLQLQWALLALLSMLFGLRVFPALAKALVPVYLLIVVYNFADLYWPPAQRVQDVASFDIAQLNLRYDNPHADEIFSRLLRGAYDVVVIQEISDRQVERLGQLGAAYPHAIGSTSLGGHSSGHVLLSRWPLSERKIHNLGYADGRVIDVLVAPDGSNAPIRVLALHPGAPRNRELWELRNATFEFIAAEVGNSAHRRQVVVGDLNVTPWSPVFRDLLGKSGLRDSSSGQGYIPSWSFFAHDPVSRLLSSAYIDHCLFRGDFSVRDKQSELLAGSDHRLVITRLAFQ